MRLGCDRVISALLFVASEITRRDSWWDDVPVGETLRASEWKRTVRPHLGPGVRWEFRGRLCDRARVSLFVMGVLGEGSSFDQGVYVWRVTMPLYVPGETVVLTYSRRIGGGRKKFYSSDPDELNDAIRCATHGLADDDEELRQFQELDGANATLHRLEVADASNVLAGHPENALRLLRVGLRAHATRDWEDEVLQRLYRALDARFEIPQHRGGSERELRCRN